MAMEARRMVGEGQTLTLRVVTYVGDEATICVVAAELFPENWTV